MNSRKVKEMVKFSISKDLRNKWFVILNIFVLISIIITTNLDSIKKFLEDSNIKLFNENVTIEIVDTEKIGIEKFIEHFKEDDKISVKQIDKNEYTKETIKDETIVVEINSDDEKILKTKITSKEGLDGILYNEILQIISDIRNERFSNNFNIETEKLSMLSEEPNIERIMLGVDVDNYDTKEIIKLVSTFLIYFVSIFIFSNIANTIAQEKVSKSIEYVLTSVTEKEYLLAKIISVISFILLQAVYFIIYYVIGNSLNTLINLSQMQSMQNVDLISIIQGVDKEIILYIITVFVYGILTLILMSIIQAALSSKTTNMTEAGNTTTLLMMITIFSYFFTLFLITPETNMTFFIYLISCIPLLSNYFIPAIMIIGQATPLQIVISLVLLIISIPIAFKICAKIFKNGVLDYKPNQKSKNKKVERTEKEEQEHKLKIYKYRKFSFVIGMSCILIIALQLIGQLLLTTLIAPLVSEYFTSIQIELIIMCLISAISFLVARKFVGLFQNEENIIKPEKLSKSKEISIVLIGIFLLGIIQIVLPYIYSFFDIEYNMESLLDFSNTENNLLTNILSFITIAVQAAIFEELFFRKSIIDFSKQFGKVFAIILSSIIFGLIHLNTMQCIFAIFAGLVFGTIYVITGNIKLTILLHFLNNGYSVLLMIFENNQIIVNIINFIIIALMISGAICCIKAIIKNKDKIKSLKIDKENLQEYKYIFLDFTFIIAIVMLAIIFVATESMLTYM